MTEKDSKKEEKKQSPNQAVEDKSPKATDSKDLSNSQAERKAESSAVNSSDEKKLSQKDQNTKPAKQNASPVEKKAETEKKVETEKKDTICLSGLFAFKMSMSTFYNEKGESFPVTALKYEPCFVSQIKTKEKESYTSIQLAFKPQKNKRCSKALIKHLTPAGFKEGARFVKEIRQTLPEGIKSGQEVSIESLKKGDLVKLSALS